MKLAEVLEDIFKDGPLYYNGQFSNLLQGKSLEAAKDRILQCDEFKDSMVELIEWPNISVDSTLVKTYSYVLKKDSKFKGKLYLYSIFLTPTIYDSIEESISKSPEKLLITPIFIDGDFTPYKTICLSYNPETLQDKTIKDGENQVKELLHNQLDKILENPEKYQPPLGYHGIIVRCFPETFEAVSVDNEQVILK